MVKARHRYDAAAAALKDLLDKRDALCQKKLLDAIAQSGRSYEEIIQFLQSKTEKDSLSMNIILQSDMVTLLYFSIMKTAALYVRTDTPDAESIRRQINNLSTYANTHGYIVTRTFADDGCDGNSTNRSGFDGMMNAAKHHSISTAMATDGSRRARDIILLRKIIRELSENSIRVILLYEKSQMERVSGTTHIANRAKEIVKNEMMPR